jgi:hypothetical protein
MQLLREYVEQEGLGVKATSKAELFRKILECKPHSESGTVLTAPSRTAFENLRPHSSLHELKEFAEKHGIDDVKMAGPGRTKQVIAAELLAAARKQGEDVGGRASCHALCISSPGEPGKTQLTKTFSDCEHVRAMLTQKGVPVEIYKTSPDGTTRREEALQRISDFLAQPSDVKVLYYSGHGAKGEEQTRLGGETGGALSVGGALSEEQGLVTFEDIVNAWEKAKGMRRGLRLVLVVDACYSGKLVAKLRDMPNGRKEALGLAIQAAGNARQGVKEAEALHAGKTWQAGLFTGYWVPKQTDQVIPLSRPCARNCGGSDT